MQLALVAADLHLVAETLTAVLAHVRSLARVSTSVPQQVRGDAEALAAVATRIGSLACMRALVLHKR